MKYIEELSFGDTFSYKSQMFLLTSDFKANGQRLCYSLVNGQPSWLPGDTIIDHSPIYILDKDNNIIAIKISKKEQ